MLGGKAQSKKPQKDFFDKLTGEGPMASPLYSMGCLIIYAFTG